MKKPVIEFKDFTFQYFAQAEPTLHNINLTIYEGEKVLIVGPSGSGKSTLLRTLCGIYQPDGGEIYCSGETVFENTATKEKIIYFLNR